MNQRICWLAFALIAIFSFSANGSPAQNKQPKYVFYFIGDGMGVNQVNGTEMYLAEREGKIGIKPLNFTQFPVATLVNTYSQSHSVTCSAAAGTALATGNKTVKGAISVDSTLKMPLVTIAEKAKRAGKKIGITTSVSIDHATPAVFYAYQPNRKMAYEIGTDLARSNFDFFAGSGFIEVKSPTDKQAEDLLKIISDSGYVFARGYDDFKVKYPKASKMVLMQKEGKDVYSLPYYIDRQKDDLTLPQITESAIQFLTKENENGFFLMVEGGKIDWACHGNDGATAFKEVIDFADAIQVALDFYQEHPDETLIVITADHETGGISLSTKDYTTNFKALDYQLCSQDFLSEQLKALREKNPDVSWEDVQALLKKNLGFWDSISLNAAQEKRLKDQYTHSFVAKDAKDDKSMYAENDALASLAKQIMNEIAMIGWSTSDHTAGFVALFVIGVGADQFTHKMDNTEIPKKISQIAGY